MASSNLSSGHRFGAAIAFLCLSVVAGLLVAIGVTPALAIAGLTTKNAESIFDKLPEYLELSKLPERNVLFADKGGQQVPLATIYHQNRVEVAASEIASTLKAAAVSGEDKRFFDHNGIDATSTARAVVGQLTHDPRGGASTLTMQLVRNVFVAEAEEITDPKARLAAYEKVTDENLARKLTEMRYALGLEKKYSKEQILTAYLNIAFFGHHAYGVEAAAQHFYGKSAKALSPAEAASLVATVQSPSARNLSSAANYPANKARRDVILQAMLDEKKIDQAAYQAAVATPVGLYVHLTPATQGCLAVTEPGAGQWCDLITRLVTTLPSLGKDEAERKANWRRGGYEIHTSLNLDLTATAKNELVTYAPNTETRYDPGGVVISIEATTGRVIVMTQNKDFNNSEAGGGAGSTSINYAVDHDLGGSTGFQPGSTYKPFTLLDWLAKGHKLYETVNAAPRVFTPMTACGVKSYSRDFHPKNDNGGDPGTVTALRATTHSINTGYAAMAQKLDLCDIRDTAKSLGVHAADGAELSSYPSSVIGSGNEIAPLTMAAAFAGIANGGVFCEPRFIDSVVDTDGKALTGQPENCSQEIDPTVAATAVAALKTVFTQGTAVAANPRDGIPVMGKTGTTDGAQQTWLVGGTTKVTTAAWVGNITGHQNQYKISGAHGAMNQQRLTIWKHVMQAVDQQYGGDAFPRVSSSALAKPLPKPTAPPLGEAGAQAGNPSSRAEASASSPSPGVGSGTGLDTGPDESTGTEGGGGD